MANLDTLGYSRHLEKAGVTRKQADAHAEAVRDFMLPDLVSKSDLRNALLVQTVAFGAMLAVAVGLIVERLPS